MMNKDLYKQEVYKKYQNRNTKIIINEYEKKPVNYFKLVAVIIFCIGILGGTGYATMEIYKNFKSEEKVPIKDEEVVEPVDKRIYLEHHPNLIDYKLISNYEEYQKYKEMWPQLLEMEENDFDEYILLLTVTGSEELNGFYITNITSDDTTMYVEYDVNQEDNSSNDFMSTKIEKSMKKDNIDFKQIYHLTEHKEFKKLTEIPDDYSIEGAINDGCFVIDDNEIVSSNKEQLEDFVTNTQNGNKDFIRIYRTSLGGYNKNEKICSVIDIEFDGEKYIYNSNTLIDESAYKFEIQPSKIKYNLIFKEIEVKINKQYNKIFVNLIAEDGIESAGFSYNIE